MINISTSPPDFVRDVEESSPPMKLQEVISYNLKIGYHSVYIYICDICLKNLSDIGTGEMMIPLIQVGGCHCWKSPLGVTGFMYGHSQDVPVARCP